MFLEMRTRTEILDRICAAQETVNRSIGNLIGKIDGTVTWVGDEPSMQDLILEAERANLVVKTLRWVLEG